VSLTSFATECVGRAFAGPLLPFHAFSATAAGPSHGAGGTPENHERRTLAKEELFTLEGQIDEILPDGRFGVMLDNEHRLICYTAGKMRKHRIRSVVGDRVHVEMTPYDLSKGRIVFRERTPGAGPGIKRRAGFRR
jgi:translation initiation factor IF-1